MAERLGVGIIGCGQAAQAIHLPALASLPSDFRVVRCVDVDTATAEQVAQRCGAVAGTDAAQVYQDPLVDVVLVTSPERFHPDHVIGACHAGKRAVLCEKPLAGSAEAAQRIVDVSRQTGVPVIVANMHLYDPALQALAARWGDLPSRAGLVRSVAYLTPNARLVGLATEPSPVPGVWQPGPGPHPAELVQSVFWGLVVGLAVHHLPLIRMAMPEFDSVDVAMALGVCGYDVSLRSGGRVAQMTSVLHYFPWTKWTFEMWASDAAARIEYPPGYLPSQSATGRLWAADEQFLTETSVTNAFETGYRAEWRHVADVVRGRAAPRRGVDEARSDIALAERIIWSFLEKTR